MTNLGRYLRYCKTNLVGEGEEESFREGGGELMSSEYFMLMGYHKTNLLMRYRKTNLVGEGEEESFREGGGELMSSECFLLMG